MIFKGFYINAARERRCWCSRRASAAVGAALYRSVGSAVWVEGERKAVSRTGCPIVGEAWRSAPRRVGTRRRVSSFHCAATSCLAVLPVGLAALRRHQLPQASDAAEDVLLRHIKRRRGHPTTRATRHSARLRRGLCTFPLRDDLGQADAPGPSPAASPCRVQAGSVLARSRRSGSARGRRRRRLPSG